MYWSTINRYKYYIVACIIITVVILFSIFFFKKKDTNASKEEARVENNYVIQGIDISHHNIIPDWRKLKTEGVAFVYMKATEGVDHEDRHYAYNYSRAGEADIKIGTYHFYTFGVSGKEQAAHFIKTAKSKSGDLIPAIDVEHSRINPYSSDKVYQKKVIDELVILENELYRHWGVRPIIYTNKECYELYIRKKFPENLLWLVDLENEPSMELNNWVIWQYTHKGRIPGIEGYIDLNFYRYTAKEFQKLLLH